MDLIAARAAPGIDNDVDLATDMAAQHAAFKMASVTKGVGHLIRQAPSQTERPKAGQRTDQRQNGQNRKQMQHEGHKVEPVDEKGYSGKFCRANYCSLHIRHPRDVWATVLHLV